MKYYLKFFLPRTLYGRAALILIVPIVTIQLVVSIGFMQRHFDDVTVQMTKSVAEEIVFMIAAVQKSPSGQKKKAVLDLAEAFNLDVKFVPNLENGADLIWFLDLPGGAVISTFRSIIPTLQKIDLITKPFMVRLFLPTEIGPLYIEMSRLRVSVRNPHQLLVLMLIVTLLMTLVAYIFLRNQLRPIAKLAEAAESYGMGTSISYRPRGALEVRAAGKAFVQMRERIERQIEQRTMMVSGVGHDLRTPLTRLRLGLSMLPEDDEILALIRDVSDMERLIDEFLAFAKGDALEEQTLADLVPVIKRVIRNLGRLGHDVKFDSAEATLPVVCAETAIARAVENLTGNAVRYGSHTKVTLRGDTEWVEIQVDDNGPGIEPAFYEKAILPFSRLEKARDPNRGGGVGLGLSIANDIATSHGGSLELSKSDMGGLRALLRISMNMPAKFQSFGQKD
ncbi:MAG: ATP-binding protein [Paracoccaceae bacterium]|jgi:two-component system osmolarity sensor histidine kinase EnvZ